MSVLVDDLRFSLRVLLKNRGFTFVSVLTLALAMGANTAIFSVVHGVLLRPLPYPEPQQLVQLLRRGTDGKSSSHTIAHYTWLSTQAPVFSHVTAQEPLPSGFSPLRYD